MPVLTVAGSLSSPLFHEARLVAEDIITEDAALKLRVVGLVESEWLEYLARVKGEHGGRAYDHTSDLAFISHSVLGYLGSTDELITWADQLYQTGDPRSDKKTYGLLQSQFGQIAEQQLASYVASKQGESKFAFLEFTVPASDTENANGASSSSARPGQTTHRIVVELFASRCPRTVENFLALCTGEKGVSASGVSLHYLSTPMHRVVRDAWLQFGDIVSGRGNAGESIFGPTFEDESLEFLHDGPGVLAMASAGTPHTNGSQFYVTLKDLPSLDGKRVVFGRIVLGLEALAVLNAVPLRMQRPLKPVLISGCGVFAPAVDPEAGAAGDRAAVRATKPEDAAAVGNGTGGARRRRGGKKAEFETTVAIVGPMGGGKSSLVNVLKGDPEAEVAPTNGFELSAFPVGARARPLRVFGLGGGEKIKGIWQHYYDDVHGLVFVVDAQNRAQFDAAAADYAALVTHDRVVDKPVLVLLNKTDDENAADDKYITPHEVIVKFHIKSAHSDLFHVVPVSARASEGGKPAASLSHALEWLIDAVAGRRAALQARIEKDVAASARKKQEAALQRRLERARKEEEAAASATEGKQA